MKCKIYLMARYSRHPEMQEVAHRFQRMGHAITSRWIWGEHQASDAAIGTGTLGDFERRLAQEDIADLSEADLCISFSDPLGTPMRGGKHVELGMAIAWGKRIINVGNREHVFHALPQIMHVADHEKLYTMMGEEGVGHPVVVRGGFPHHGK